MPPDGSAGLGPGGLLTVVALTLGFAAMAAAAAVVGRLDRGAEVSVPVIGAVAALSTVLTSGASPTGWVPLDVVLVAAVAGIATVVAGTAPRRVVIVAAIGLAAALVVCSSPLEAVGAFAIGAIGALVATKEDARTVRAAAMGAIAVVALDLHSSLGTGATAVAGAIVLVPVIAAGFVAAAPNVKRIAVWGAAAIVAVCALGGATAGVLAWSVRHSVDEGVRAARAGLAAIDGDDRATATAQMATAESAFGDAHASLRAPWGRLAYVVPVVAQQVRAVDTLALSGRDLARTASDALEIVDPGEIRPEGGQIDLQVVESLRAPLAAVSDVLDRSDRRLARASSEWLLPPVQRRHAELTRRVDRASEQADLAARAVAAAPALLGADRPRRFLLAVYTPVESRGGGGFMGNFGELTADHGRVTLSRFGRIRELEQGGPDPAGRTITGHREYLANWGRFKPAQYWGIVNLTNDFPTAADVMRQLYPQSGGTDVDGVIAIDPDGVAAFLRVTGPISVPGVDLTLTPENAREILLHDQYLLPEASRVDYLGDASRALFERLTTGELPGIAALAKEVAPAVAGRHLQLWSSRDDEQALFARIGGTGAVPSVRGDSVGVIGQNFNGNKIDWFLQRRLTYDAKWDPGTGEVRSTLDVTLENRAPSSGEPHSVIGWGGDEILGQAPVQDGENLMLLTIYSALPPTRVTVDGSSVEMNRSKELGRTTSRFYVRVPAGATRAVHAEFHGAIEQGSTYRFDPLVQPLPNADTMQVSVHVGDRWELAPHASATWTLDRPHRLDVTACPVRPIPLLELRTNC